MVDRIVKLGFERVIGTSGTILSLGALAAANGRPVGSDALRNRRIPTKQIRRIRRELSAMPLADRLRIPGLDPRRADLAVAGAIVLDAILKRLRARDITLCDLALREGLALDYIRRNRAHIANIEKYPDVRLRSVFELAERCNFAREHSLQVARLALEIFDRTQPAHRLDGRAREWLEYAALLHDIGIHISHARHHKHSYYLVRNGDLRGFEPQEVEIMALAARYHRRAQPKRSHEGYGHLGAKARRTVRTLGAILRVAENLDRSQQQSVASLTVVPGPQDYLIRLKPDGDTELELWAAQRSVAPLAKALRRVIRFEVVVSNATRAPARRPRTKVRGRVQRTASAPAAAPSGVARPAAARAADNPPGAGGGRPDRLPRGGRPRRHRPGPLALTAPCSRSSDTGRRSAAPSSLWPSACFRPAAACGRRSCPSSSRPVRAWSGSRAASCSSKDRRSTPTERCTSPTSRTTASTAGPRKTGSPRSARRAAAPTACASTATAR